VALADLAVDERGGAGEAPPAPALTRPGRRRRFLPWLLVLAALLLVAGAGGYAWASTPQVELGVSFGAGDGLEQLTDGVAPTRWWQSARFAHGMWTIRNTGPVAVTFTSGPDPEILIDPPVTVGFAATSFPYYDTFLGGTIMRSGALPSDVVKSITVAPGHDVSVLVMVDANRCFVPISATKYHTSGGGLLGFTSVHATATALGRSSVVELPLPFEWAIPYPDTCDGVPSG